MPENDLAVLQLVEDARMAGGRHEVEHVRMRLDQVRYVRSCIEEPAGPRGNPFGEKEAQPGICRDDDAAKLGVSLGERRAAARNRQGISVRAAVLRHRQAPPQRRTDVLKHRLVRRGYARREHPEDTGSRARASVSRSHHEMIETRSAVNGLFSSNSAKPESTVVVLAPLAFQT